MIGKEFVGFSFGRGCERKDRMILEKRNILFCRRLGVGFGVLWWIWIRWVSSFFLFSFSVLCCFKILVVDSLYCRVEIVLKVGGFLGVSFCFVRIWFFRVVVVGVRIWFCFLYNWLFIYFLIKINRF